MSAPHTHHETTGQLELPIIEIDTAEITMLVAPINPETGHAGSSGIYAGYPVDMDAGARGVAEQLRDICADEDITLDQLEVVGAEVADPEQYNTVVTLDREVLAQVNWIGRNEVHILGIPTVGQLTDLAGQAESTCCAMLPMYAA